MTRLPWSQAGLGICCLMLFIAGASGGEFRLLEPHSETRLDRIEQFVAADAFKVGTQIGGRTLSAIGLNFAEHFLGVLESNVPESHMHGWTLWYTAGDESLIEASGGEDGVIRSLACIHHLMELGDNGPSHLDWQSNFAYLRSPVDRRIWAVHWTVNYAGEWNIGAVYVPHPQMDWRSGSRLFSGRTVEPKTGTTSLSHVRNR
jgi:hypothetical protein